MELAPILVSVYTRFMFLRKCINSLKRNKYAEDSILYIVSDAPINKEHLEAVNTVRDYIKEINGFNKVILIKREYNWGSQKSVLSAITEIINKHERIIFLEDDNVVSPNFLSFVNKGLQIYENREDIFSISGFNSPIKIPKKYKHDIYLRDDFVAYGVGLWKNKWENVDWSINGVNAFLDNKQIFKRFSKIYEKSVTPLLRMRETGLIIGDGICTKHLFLNKMYSVFPVISRVRNIGWDGSGEHCGKEKKYLHQKIYEGTTDAKFPPNLELYPFILNFIKNKHRKYSIKQRIKVQFKKIINLNSKELINW